MEKNLGIIFFSHLIFFLHSSLFVFQSDFWDLKADRRKRKINRSRSVPIIEYPSEHPKSTRRNGSRSRGVTARFGRLKVQKVKSLVGKVTQQKQHMNHNVEQAEGDATFRLQSRRNQWIARKLPPL
ncbi:hypothetical protein EUTSA_v10015023mg [Eutrema salsugineum]|uniref:Uncharacterized protein n=1 Tax=Eutrema salsugineum TaxID=72664 RepID=V4LN58_EUTSA|nr:uncharacterized protein LOC18019328 [Eutrema salsugineum]ESQ41278.1 hypothetical protein EUTSA_v10015023mg [Eutrema salsugineum]